jgi:hypothetical protein
VSVQTPSQLWLQRPGILAHRWGAFLTALGPTLADDADPWVLHPFGLLGAKALPDAPAPAVYAALNLDGECRYVGQTVDIRGRFRGHESDAGKRQHWNYVLVATLRPDIAHPVLGNAETTARRLCRPVEGVRTPRLR